MEQQAEALREEALTLIASANDAAALEAARLRYLGKNGAITSLSEGMRNVPKEERPRFGKILNDLRSVVGAALEGCEKRLLETADSAAVTGQLRRLVRCRCAFPSAARAASAASATPGISSSGANRSRFPLAVTARHARRSRRHQSR